MSSSTETRDQRPQFLGNFRQSRGILENLGNLERKMTNSRILEQFEHSPDILTTFHWQKR